MITKEDRMSRRNLKRADEWDAQSEAKWKDRGLSGFKEQQKEKSKNIRAWAKDQDLIDNFGIDAPKARSFGVNPNVAKGKMNVSDRLDMTNEELRKKFGKKAGGKIKKSKKVRGAGIAKRGVKKCKYR